jgi:hypothetical protein
VQRVLRNDPGWTHTIDIHAVTLNGERKTMTLVLSLCLLAAGAAADVRPEFSLNGAWEYQLVPELTSPPNGGEWKGCTVPGYLNGTNYQRAWLRRSFTVPATLRGQRLKLHFGGVKYHSRVYLNGRHVGGCFGGYEPFAVDVTDTVRFDGPNQLAVGCHDWTGVFSPGKVEFPQHANWDVVRGTPRDKILSPIGGLFGMYGIWDDVTLRAYPAVYVQDSFIKPSVRRGELVVDYTVANESAQAADVELEATVEDGGTAALALPTAKLRVPAGGTATTTLRQAWSRPPLWSHADPHLLHLRTELSTGDRLRTRFGFREFWVEGHKFFLNGARVNLLATSWWPPHGTMTREEIRKQWEAIKQIGCVAFRTHTQPWPSLHYEVADEVGLLMIIEGAVWNDDDTYRIYDPVFWENYARHLRAMVDRDKNRPSVVMWSLENEFLGGRLNDTSPAKKDLVRMGRLVKQHDPTRPIFFESDGDPDGVADVIGIHYPHEYPDFTCWPNEALWLQRPAQIPHMFLNGAKEFAWRKDKPIYVGEFLWVPSRDPSWHTVFFGDEAYRDYQLYRNLAKAESWKMQILGYRHLEVGGISPWTVIEGGPLDSTNPLLVAHRNAYQRIAAYPLQYDSRFYANEMVRRRLVVFNDVLEASTLDVRWQLRPALGTVPLDRGQQRLELGPGEQGVIEVSMRMPPVAQGWRSSRTSWTEHASHPLDWKLEIEREGRTVFTAQHPCEVFSRFQLKPPAGRKLPALHVYDPGGATRQALASMGVEAAVVASLRELPAPSELLVIGANTLQADAAGVPVVGAVRPERQALHDYVTHGGRLLVLHQQAYPEGLFDVQLTDHQSTMAFCGVDAQAELCFFDEWLRFWHADHLVATHEPARPVGGGFQAAVVSGSATGIDFAPVLVQHAGRGCVVYSQLLAVEKFAHEPAAADSLLRMIEYLLDYRSPTRKTGVVGPPVYRDYLRHLGLHFDDLTGRAATADLGAYRLLVCRGELPAPTRLREFVQQGGHLLLHRIPQDTLQEFLRAAKLDLDLQSYNGPVTRAEGLHQIFNPLLREDLYWLGRHVGIDWAETPRAGEMTDGVLVKTIGSKAASTYEIEDWQRQGTIVERQKPGLVFATNGSATAKIDFPSNGTYIIGLVARGTPCAGQWPIAQVSIDGQLFGTAAVSRSEWHTTSVFGMITKGPHQVSVAFVNDASNPPQEDRNLYVDKVLVARDDGADGIQLLTNPGATADVTCGGGRVTIDLVRWDTEEPNARKAARLASAILTDLGGDFRPRRGVTLECERMTPQPGMSFFSNQGSSANLACNGYIRTPLQVATAGRYTLELVAAGTPAQGVYPLVEITLDGQRLGQVQLTAGSWRSYFLDLDLPAGEHEFRLSFVNDLNAAGEDRNLMLDKVSFGSSK